VAALALILMAAPGLVQAAGTIEWIGPNIPNDMSSNGKVVVGNATTTYEAYRWTAETGIVLLGMNPSEFGLGGAGAPEVSDDGNHVSATIINPDTTGHTQGIWTKGEGWVWSMPPVPEGAGLGDDLGSCWGISGDGTTLTGFVWFSGGALGSAQGNSWSVNTGMNILPQPVAGHSSRVNSANYDGSVVVGWSEADFGTWRPTVWEDGGYTILHDSDWFCLAEGITSDGNTIWGEGFNPESGYREAAVWQRTETGWVEQLLGGLPGTFPEYGQVTVLDMTEDARTAVGYNGYDWYSGEAFVWTLDQGMMAADDFLAAEGIDMPAGFIVSSLTAISDNGVTLAGYGYYPAIFPQQYEGFVVTRENVSPVPDAQVATGLRLEANYPNPFNPSTQIALVLDKDQSVRLGVYNAAGRLVRQLHDGHLTAGRNEITWDGKDSRGQLAASGVYFARATGEAGETLSRRMTLVK